MNIQEFDLITINHLYQPIVMEGIEISPTFSYFLREKRNIFTKAIYQSNSQKIIYIWERSTQIPFHKDEHLLAFAEYCNKFN
jgi:hypothetical protein